MRISKKSSERHSLDHLLPSYKSHEFGQVQIRSQAQKSVLLEESARNTETNMLGDNEICEAKETSDNEQAMKGRANSNGFQARTGRRGQALDPAVALFFDPKTSVSTDLLKSPQQGARGGANQRHDRKNKNESNKKTGSNDDLSKDGSDGSGAAAAAAAATEKASLRVVSGKVRKKEERLKAVVEKKKERAPAKKQPAMPKKPQNSTQYIMAERRRKTRPERPIKSLTSPRAERLASPGVPPKSNLNMFGSMLEMQKGGDDIMDEDDDEDDDDVEADDDKDMHELVENIFNEQAVSKAGKKINGVVIKTTNADSDLHKAQNVLIEQQAKRIGELQNEIIRLKMKIRDFEDDKLLQNAGSSGRLMNRMKGLFKF